MSSKSWWKKKVYLKVGKYKSKNLKQINFWSNEIIHGLIVFNQY